MTSAQQPVSVLILDADPAQRRMLSTHLGAGRRFRPVACDSLGDALQKAAGPDRPVIIADLGTAGGPSGLGTLAATGRPLIATSAGGSLSQAVDAMRAGAADFIAKPVGAKALIERLEAAMARWQDSPRRHDPAAAKPVLDFEGFVGRSAAMRAVYRQIEQVAASRAPVFLTGESGTGKEVAATAIHGRGGAERPFIAINCGAIPKDLVESEVFGHVRGAFTSATEDRTGAAELAHGGTLFLDEIGEMPLALQAKLLRFIQTGAITRVGDARPRQVDVRILCATNRDPVEAVRKGRFREDLFYRLNVLPIRLPALRDRPDDIHPLAAYFLSRTAAEEGSAVAGFDAEAAALLSAQAWPGNVRQLENVVRRLAVMAAEPIIDAATLADALSAFGVVGRAEADPVPPQVPRRVLPFHEQERRIIEEALAAFGGNISRAAAALQINPSTIYRKRQAWDRAAG
ncbi:MAG: sigma-54-dependent Fis family transcriptional regulator [Bauldia sp.]|nr:sigma-54-dependent Fis family transcriptional regulator [Bauldia sp.]